MVQEGRRRRQPARLSRLRRDARHLVHGRRGADRGDQRRRRDAGHRGRPALDHRLPLSRAGCRNSRRAGARSPIPGRSSRSRNAASCWSAADGTISSYDYDDHVTLQTRKTPAHDARAGRHAAAGPARADRIHARPHRGRRADHRAARPGALPRRAADRRQRRALGRRRSAPSRSSHDRDAGPRRLQPEERGRRRSRGARAALPAADAEKLSAADRAGRGGRHFRRASRRLSRRPASTSR